MGFSAAHGLSRPARAGRRAVVVRQFHAGGIRVRFVAGDGEHHGRPVLWQQLADEALDAPVDLDGGRSRGQGEVEAVHQLSLVHLGKAPERGLRLAGAGFGLDDDQLLIQRRALCSRLDGVRRG